MGRATLTALQGIAIYQALTDRDAATRRAAVDEVLAVVDDLCARNSTTAGHPEWVVTSVPVGELRGALAKFRSQ